MSGSNCRSVQKWGLLKQNGDPMGTQKAQKVPIGDLGPQLGTPLGAVCDGQERETQGSLMALGGPLNFELWKPTVCTIYNPQFFLQCRPQSSTVEVQFIILLFFSPESEFDLKE